MTLSLKCAMWPTHLSQQEPGHPPAVGKMSWVVNGDVLRLMLSFRKKEKNPKNVKKRLFSPNSVEVKSSDRLERLKVSLTPPCFFAVSRSETISRVPTVISRVIHTHEICLCRKLCWVINWQGVRQYLERALEMAWFMYQFFIWTALQS